MIVIPKAIGHGRDGTGRGADHAKGIIRPEARQRAVFRSQKSIVKTLHRISAVAPDELPDDISIGEVHSAQYNLWAHLEFTRLEPGAPMMRLIDQEALYESSPICSGRHGCLP